ncbi:CUB and peptidase domain-containing protein 2-like, partial [Oculina patagonica]
MPTVFYSHDYLNITNAYSDPPTFGMYCGKRTKYTVAVVGNYSVIRFHSDSDDVQRRGFLISFTAVPLDNLKTNTLKSPGHPSTKYPRNTHLVYTVPIPDGQALRIYFHDFNVPCNVDYSYLRISNEKSQSFGVYCGNASMHIGKEVIVTGTCAVITFHAGNGLQGQGFFLILILTTVDQ